VQVMSNLFHIDKVGDPAQIGRILTLEYLIKQFDGRIHVNFRDSTLSGSKRCAA